MVFGKRKKSLVGISVMKVNRITNPVESRFEIANLVSSIYHKNVLTPFVMVFNLEKYDY